MKKYLVIHEPMRNDRIKFHFSAMVVEAKSMSHAVRLSQFPMVTPYFKAPYATELVEGKEYRL